MNADAVSPRRRWFTMRFGVPWVVLGLTAAADWLFYGHPLGWTLGGYAAAVAVLLTLHARPWARRWSERLLVLALPPAAALVLRTGWLAVVMVLALVAALAVAARGGAPALAAGWPRAIARLAANAWPCAWRDWRFLARRSRGAKPRPSRRLARNWGLPVCLTLAFLLLFSIANPVIALWLAEFRDWVVRLTEDWFAPLRWLFWFAAASLAWGLLRYRVRRAAPAPPPMPPRSVAAAPMLPLARTLGLFNAVFALQNLLDARYLLGGAALPNGMTYA